MTDQEGGQVEVWRSQPAGDAARTGRESAGHWQDGELVVSSRNHSGDHR